MKRNIKLLLSMIVMSIGIMAFGNINVFASVAGYTWMDAASMSTARTYHTATLVKDGNGREKVLVVGGRSSSLISDYLNTVELYDPSNNTWTNVDSMSVARAYHTATLITVAGKEKVLVAGGRNSDGNLNSAEIFDPATNKWTSVASMSTTRAYHTATLLQNGKVLVAGGHYNSTDLKTAEIYDPSTETWSSTGSMLSVRYSHTATLLPSGEVLVAGGCKTVSGDATVLSKAEIYDPSLGTWKSTKSMFYGGLYTAMLQGDNTVLLIGKATQIPEKYDCSTELWTKLADPSTTVADCTSTLMKDGKVLAVDDQKKVRIYDPGTNVWTNEAPMVNGRNNCTATLLQNGNILIAGGYDEDGGGYLNTAEIYAPNTVTWSSTSAMSGVRAHHTATLIKDENGKVGVLVVGGYKNPYNYLNTAEIYDVNSKAWTSVNPMKYTRKEHTATLLNDGRVLVVGGKSSRNSSDILNSVEIYTPATGLWSDAAPMLSKRYTHAATLLPDGRVLVTGGTNSDGRLNTAEIYDPVSNKWTYVNSMSDSRSGHVATLIKDKNDKYVLMVFGGYSENYRTVEAYDYLTDIWTRKSQMLETPDPGSFQATVLTDQKVLITGDGFSDDGDKAFIYNYDLDTWTQVGDLNQSRRNHQAILLLNGKVLAIGGGYYNGVSQVLLKSVEIYDPGNDKWLYVADMFERRYDGHTATVLPDGSVLVVGGDDNYQDAISSAELLASPMVPDTTPPIISSISNPGNVDFGAGSYDVYAYGVTDNVGVASVSFPTWTTYNEQDELKWYAGTDMGGNTWKATIPFSEHNYEKGTYVTDVYAYDAAGNTVGKGGATSNVLPTYDATIASSTLPSTMNAGATQSVTVKVTNTGFNTWSAANNYKLGAVGESDPFAGTRQLISGSTTVATGQSYTFTFDMTAPSTSGTYTSDWSMLQEGVTWFGETVTKSITVQDTTPPNSFTPSITINSSTSVTMSGTTTDDSPGMNPTTPYLWLYLKEGDSSWVDWIWTINTSRTITGMSPNTRYYFQVPAMDAAGNINWGTAISKYTLANMPSSPTYGTITQTSMVLNWDTNSNSSSTQYFAAVVVNGADPENMANWVANSGWQTNISTWTATGLTAGTQYRAYVKAKNGDEIRTNWIDFGAKWTLPNMPNNIVGNNDGLAWSSTAGRGWVTLSWPAITGVVGYKVLVFDGNEYRTFDVGYTTSWDSRTAKIYPAESTLNGFGDNTQSADLFNHSATGLDLRDNPNTLYKKTIGTTYDTATNYWFRVTAYNSSGDSGVDWTQGYWPTLPNRTSTSAPGAPTINFTSPVGYISGNWSNSNVSFTITNGIDNGGSGIQKSQYSTNGGSSWTDYTSELTISTQGTTAILARTIDNVGNIGSNTSANINIDTSGPTGSIYINGGAIITDYEIATLSLSAADATTSVAGMKISNNSDLSGANWETYSSSKSWNLVGGNNTIYVAFRDTVYNESIIYSATIKYEILPTLNAPSLNDEIYKGYDTVLSSTGTNIASSSYRIYYTNKTLAPPIVANFDNPGTGWIDSGITGSMNITGTTDISNTILASTFSNVDWTHVVFKVGVGSGTGNWVIKYTTSYNLNDPNDIIGYIGHNQIITIIDSGNEIVVSNPAIPVLQYGPYDQNDINKLNANNTFENGESVKYRLEFDMLKPSEITKLKIYFDYNFFNSEGIQFLPTSMILKKLNDDGSITSIKTFTTDIEKQDGTNVYYIIIQQSQVNSIGRYFVECSGVIDIEQDYYGTAEQITSGSIIELFTLESKYAKTASKKAANRKTKIDTKITRGIIPYQ